jgi:hypothetical protein
MAERARGLRRLFVLAAPLVALGLALIYRNEGSAHGDAVHYRVMAQRFLDEGTLPLAPLEWYHPGFYLVVGAARGLVANLADAHLLVSFVVWALLMLVAARWWRAAAPEASMAPFAAAWLLASLPAAQWMVQDTMSDLAGQGLVFIAALLALMPGPRRRRHLVLAGLLFGLAITFRVSTLALFPLLLTLVWRPGESPRATLRAAAFFAVACLMAPALVATCLIATHDLEAIAAVLGTRSADNLWHWERLRDSSSELIAWGGYLGRGMSPLSLGVALIALVFAGRRREFRRGLGWRLAAGALYPLALLFNRSAFEFRYQLPFMLGLTLMTPLLWARNSGPGQTKRSLLGALGLLVMVAAQMAWAQPWMEATAAREGFVRAGARLAARVVGDERGIFAGSIAARWLAVEDPEVSRIVLDEGPKPDLREARRRFRIAVGHGLDAFTLNEIGSLGLRRELEESGWRARVLRRRAASELRHREDAHWILFDPSALTADRDLILEAWDPPAVGARWRRAPERAWRLEVEAKAHAGRELVLLAFHPAIGSARLRLGEVGIPAIDDELWRRSLLNSPRIALDSRGRGRFDFDEGAARLIRRPGVRCVGVVLVGGSSLEDAAFIFPIK